MAIPLSYLLAKRPPEHASAPPIERVTSPSESLESDHFGRARALAGNDGLLLPVADFGTRPHCRRSRASPSLALSPPIRTIHVHHPSMATVLAVRAGECPSEPTPTLRLPLTHISTARPAFGPFAAARRTFATSPASRSSLYEQTIPNLRINKDTKVRTGIIRPSGVLTGFRSSSAKASPERRCVLDSRSPLDGASDGNYTGHVPLQGGARIRHQARRRRLAEKGRL